MFSAVALFLCECVSIRAQVRASINAGMFINACGGQSIIPGQHFLKCGPRGLNSGSHALKVSSVPGTPYPKQCVSKE